MIRNTLQTHTLRRSSVAGFLAAVGLMAHVSVVQAANGPDESVVYAQLAAQAASQHADTGAVGTPPAPYMSPTVATTDAGTLQRLGLDQFHSDNAVVQGGAVSDQVDAVFDMLDSRDYRGATYAVTRLQKEYPGNDDVQSAVRAVQAYNMAELDVNAFFTPRSSDQITGGEGYGFDTVLYSAPIDYNWRLFAGTSYAHENESDGEIGYSQSRAGVEYRGTSFVASAAPTYNLYHGSERTGLVANGDWSFNKNWTAGGGYELFSHDTPLQALNAGITANKGSIDADWRQGDARELHFDGSDMQFSDGNNRLAGGAIYLENFYASHGWRIDGLVNTSMTHNSGQDDLPYYNPKTDFTGFVGPKVTQVLYRAYETRYDHNLQIAPGAYWQQGYGTTPAWTVAYGQSLHFGETFESRAGINYTREEADNQVQNDVGFTVSVVQRF